MPQSPVAILKSRVVSPKTGKSIPCAERLGSQKYSFLGNHHKMVREFLCLWEDRRDFVEAMLGITQIRNRSTTGPSLVRFLPHSYGAIANRETNSPIFYANEIEVIEGVVPRPYSEVGGELPAIARGLSRIEDTDLYIYASVRVGYTAPTYKIINDQFNESEFRLKTSGLDRNTEQGPADIVPSGISDYRRFVTKLVQPTIELLRLPIGYFAWAEGQKDGNTELAAHGRTATNMITGQFKARSIAQVTYIWHQVPALPEEGWLSLNFPEAAGGGINDHELIGALFTHLGCVNRYKFDGYNKGTLLFKGAEVRPYKWIDGNRYYDYTFRMEHFEPIDQVDPKYTITNRVHGEVLGHNWFLRQEPPKDDAGTIKADPFFCLLTHDGTKTGKPVFQYRDFHDLFVPYCRDHMVCWYKNIQNYIP